MASTVDVILGTFNGQRFLPEQLRSLETQTTQSWNLIARDDGSTDSTVSILAEFRQRHPQRVTLVEDAERRLGPRGNYGRLLEHSRADYTLFCDQDDVWLPTKIERMLDLAHREERPDEPLLMHTDLLVVDETQRQLASSFWRYQRISPQRCAWPQLLVQNVVTGCAAGINASLRRCALPVPPEAIMHDWWLALVAATCGRMVWDPVPTIAYRQHGRNDTGAKHWGMNQWRYTVGALFQPASYRRGLEHSRRQASALAQHGAPVPADVRLLLAEYGALGSRKYWRRLSFVRRHGISKNGLIRNLVFWRNV